MSAFSWRCRARRSADRCLGACEQFECRVLLSTNALLLAIESHSGTSVPAGENPSAGSPAYAIEPNLSGHFQEIPSGSGAFRAVGLYEQSKGASFSDRIVRDLNATTMSLDNSATRLDSTDRLADIAARHIEHRIETIDALSSSAVDSRSATPARSPTSAPFNGFGTAAVPATLGSVQFSRDGIRPGTSTAKLVLMSDDGSRLTPLDEKTQVPITVAELALSTSLADPSHSPAIGSRSDSEVKVMLTSVQASSDQLPPETEKPQTAVAALANSAAGIDEFFAAWIDDFISTPYSVANLLSASTPHGGTLQPEPAETDESNLVSSTSLLSITTALASLVGRKMRQRNATGRCGQPVETKRDRHVADDEFFGIS